MRNHNAFSAGAPFGIGVMLPLLLVALAPRSWGEAQAPAAKYLAGALLFNGAGAVTANHIYDGTGAAATVTGTCVLHSDCTLTLTPTVGGSTAISIQLSY